ncbi:MAG: hypothetical protein OXG79_00460 [Chloroflexi bacterium]|nr:hypothetical protein [Chloroflexota bacterium]
MDVALLGLAEGAQLALSAVFLAAGAGKWRNYDEFREAVDAHNLGPAAARNAASRVIPGLEIALGLAWLIPGLWPITSSVSIGLLAFFTAAIVINVFRGNRVSCGCFGIMQSNTIGWHSVGRNAALVTLALLPCVAYGTSSQSDVFQFMLSLNATPVTLASLALFVLLPIWIDGYVLLHSHSNKYTAFLKMHQAGTNG